MTIEHTPAANSYEERLQEQRLDQGVTNAFGARVLANGERLSREAVWKVVPIPKQYEDEISRYPHHVPNTELEPTKPLTSDEIEEKRQRFIAQEVKKPGVDELLAIARSVRSFGPLPRRDQ